MQIDWTEDTEAPVNKLIKKVYHAANIDFVTCQKFCRELYEMAFNDCLEFMKESPDINKSPPPLEKPKEPPKPLNMYVEFDKTIGKYVTKEYSDDSN